MADIPKKEIIDEIYKDKINQNNQISGELKQKNITEEEEEDKKRENDNNPDNNENNNSSKLNESHMKRRPGMYNIYPINKKDEQNKDEKKDMNKEGDDKDKEQNEIPKISPFLQKILDFESSQIGIILIIIITIIGLLFYDVKHVLIPGKFDLICMAVILVLTLYHIFDLVFRNIYLEKSVGSLHFKLQVLSVISLVFDFNLAIFLLIRFIMFKTNNKDNKYLSSFNSKLLMYIFNFVQVFKYLRFLKIYFMVNKLLKELEKKRKFNEVLYELKKKNSKSKASNGPLSGRLSKVKSNMNNATTNMIKNLRQKILEVLAAIEVKIDYPEYEDIEEVTYNDLQKNIALVEDEIIKIIKESENGKRIKEGIKTAIVGRPNVGKSSLLNRLLEEEKAIVTEIEGTTRDTVEGSIILNGIILDLIDTAGIRKTKDIVESIGVNKSIEAIEKSDLVLFVLNNNEEITEYDKNILEKIKNKNHIIIINKIDLPQKLDYKILENEKNIIKISALKQKGIEELKEKIIEMYNLEQLESKDATYLTNARGLSLLKQAEEVIKEVKKGIEEQQQIDMIEIDLKRIWELLGEITGETYQEELINQLFSQFCLGK